MPASTACSPAPDDNRGRPAGAACRLACTASDGDDPHGPARDRRAAGRPDQLHQAADLGRSRRRSSSCSGTTSRCSATTSPTRSRAPTRAAAPTSRSASAGNGQEARSRTSPATIAHRGQLDSPFGQQLNQHFAVALDNQLITVPSIDYKQYPDGIPADSGAEITGGFTISSAQDLATQLRLGALPINLKLISESQVSATLGKQALHQGLVAGAGRPARRGRCSCSLYYRVLGVIATAAWSSTRSTSTR